jgi:hypothetical protein
MADIVAFVPGVTNDARANLRDFVELCRSRLKPFGRNIDFEQDVWEITGLGGKSMASNLYLRFIRQGIKVYDRRASTVDAEALLPEPFRSFAKALIGYMHCTNPIKHIAKRLGVFRYLEAALYELTGAACPTGTTPQVLNRACALMMEITAHDTAYSYSKQLELIYRFMVQLGLVAVPSTWKTPLRAPQLRRNRVGKEFDAERAKKLPSPAALEALAQIFTSASDVPREIASSSLCALMLCAPDRISEALHLPLDCLTPDWRDPETEEVGTGLRWFPLKGAAPMIKTIIPSMKGIAERAVGQLRRISESARIVARWYEANPDQLYLPAHLEYLRSKDRLSMNELGLILFDGNGGKGLGRMWALRKELPLSGGGSGHPRYIAFQALERAILAMLPRGFPIVDPETGMRFSESLCIMRPGEFDSRGVPLQCCVIPIKYPTIRNALKDTKSQKSIFATRGLAKPDGSPLFISTHMLRHYLNTLVRQGGKLSEEDIAKWSGRKDVGQNKVYNHVSDKDMLAHIRKAVGDPTLAVGPLVNIDQRVFVSRDEFAKLKIVTAHTNGLGYCTHDFTMLPCQIHGDCINCSEQLCVKGDSAAEANLRQMQKETRMLLEKAKIALGCDDYGANQWVKHQTMTLERVDQLVAILDDPAVPVGSVIQLSGVVPASRLAQAAEKRLTLQGGNTIRQTIQSMDDVRALLADATAS